MRKNFKASQGITIYKAKVLVTQLCPTLCDPLDCSPPGSCVHGILQARLLEWVATSFPRGSNQSLALQVVSVPSEPPAHLSTKELGYQRISQQKPQTRREWNDIFKILKDKNCHPTKLYPEELPLLCELEIKAFPDRKKVDRI